MNILYLMCNIVCVVCALKRYSLCDISEDQFNKYMECAQNQTDYKLIVSVQSKCSAESGMADISFSDESKYKKQQRSCKYSECLGKIRNTKYHNETIRKLLALYTEQKNCIQKLSNNKSLGYMGLSCNITEEFYNGYKQCTKSSEQIKRELYQKCYEELGLGNLFDEKTYTIYRKDCDTNKKYSVCSRNITNSSEYKQQLKLIGSENYRSKCQKKVLEFNS